MKKHNFCLFLFFSFFINVASVQAATPDITGLMTTVNNNIIIDLAISDFSELEGNIKTGIAQEILYTVELIREWRFWPDEFVVSRQIRRSVKYDNLREQYWAVSSDGIKNLKLQFKDFKALSSWIFNVTAINLANIRELEKGRYYVRIVVETKINEDIPIAGFLMHFIPEIGMSFAKESEPFPIGDEK
ncbi:MAG: DUF4390 domain-containing protein [Nitrospira sp.]|nr:DUF4390 domain-containing protein [bacterium]MBL7049781.1 DUF4390 domain-containing protein [Nitrospira sp.]